MTLLQTELWESFSKVFHDLLEREYIDTDFKRRNYQIIINHKMFASYNGQQYYHLFRSESLATTLAFNTCYASLMKYALYVLKIRKSGKE